MKMFSKKNTVFVLWGAVIGFINGMLGSGGGMVAVPLLKKCGIEGKAAHSNAVAVILPITVISAAVYMLKGFVNFSDAAVFMPTGVIGALIGTKIIQKISVPLLNALFGGFMIYAGVRLLFR